MNLKYMIFKNTFSVSRKIHTALVTKISGLKVLEKECKKLRDFCILIQLLCLWTLSIVLFLFKTHDVSETEFCLHDRWNLLSWAQSIELVPISGHQRQHEIGYINQA
jgi:hypothetical protein